MLTASKGNSGHYTEQKRKEDPTTIQMQKEQGRQWNGTRPTGPASLDQQRNNFDSKGETIMNTRSLLLSLMLSVTSVVSASQALAAVPPVDGKGVPALARCWAGTTAGPTVLPVLHFDKIIFMVGQGQLIPVVPADFNLLNAVPRLTELDIKVKDDPKTVADLKGKVLTFLGAATTAANRALIRIVDVEYAVICGQ